MQTALSIVVPTYKEADNIALLAREIDAALKPLDIAWELVVVDDDSGDGIDAACERLVAEGIPMRLIVRTDERDLSTAVLHGFDHAQGDILVAMDADLSHPPSALPEIYRQLTTGADFAIGSRFVAGGNIAKDWPLWRWMVSRATALLAAPITRISDPMSGYFAIRRDCYERAAPLCPIGYKIALELIAKCPINRVAEVPIFFNDRRFGKSKANLKQGLLFLRHLRRLYHHVYPNWSETTHFLSVGLTGLLIDIAFYLLLRDVFGIHHIAAKALSFSTAAVSNWMLNRRYSFVRAEKHNPFAQLPKFFAVSLIGAVINVTLYWQLTAHFAWFATHPIVALCIATVCTSAWNFIASKTLVFKTAFRSERTEDR